MEKLNSKMLNSKKSLESKTNFKQKKTGFWKIFVWISKKISFLAGINETIFWNIEKRTNGR